MRRLIPNRETIGREDCPLMYRWELLATRWGKVMVHRFVPGVEDPDLHDHPWSFVTVVLAGGYDDLVRCPRCEGSGRRIGIDRRAKHTYEAAIVVDCQHCHGRGRVVGEALRAGMIRFRSAGHAHATRAGDRGAWTIVFAGPTTRLWGFWREGHWWPFREYAERFGFARTCESEDA
jgi:hypothetical protein